VFHTTYARWLEGDADEAEAEMARLELKIAGAV